jgi:hypothetical protein
MAKNLGTVIPSINSLNKHWMIGTVDTGIVAEGKTPTVLIDSASKHWMIDGKDTGIVAEGQDGAPGENAHSPYIGVNGNWYLYNDNTQSYEDSGERAQGDPGDPGDPGDRGEPGIPVIWKGNSATPPSNPELNWAYYNTAQKKSFIYNGASWDTMTQDGRDGIDGIPEAPNDGKQYARKNLSWAVVADPVTDYDILTDKPAIDGLTLNKGSTSAGLGLETAADSGNNEDLETAEKDTLVGAINEVNNAVITETENREAYDEQQDRKIQTLNGHYYPIEPYDFGKTLDVKTPVPEDITALNDYAMSEESVVEPAQIIDGTVIKNLFDGVEFVWNATDQKWVDFGIGNIVTASNDHLGVVEGTADSGDGSQDGMVTVHPGGGMEAIGFRDLKNRMEDAEETIAGKMDRSGDGMTGDLDMNGHKVLATGQLNVAEIRSITGIAGDGIEVGGILDLNGNRISGVGDPVGAGDVATKGYTDTGLGAKQDKVIPYKAADNRAGILVDLGAEVAGGAEVLFDILYNETQSGNLMRQAHIHGQFYGDMGIRTGMVQNGNVSVPVYIFKGTVEGIGNTRSYIWIPNSVAAYFPSVKVEAWSKMGTGLFDSMSPTITTPATAPVETLVEIALFSGVPGGFTASKTYGIIPGPNVPPVGVSIKLGNTVSQFYFGTVTLRQNTTGKTVKFDYGIYADTGTGWSYFTITKVLNDSRDTSVWFYRDTNGVIFLYLDLVATENIHHFIEASCTQTNNGAYGNGGEKYMLPSYTWETETPTFTNKTSVKTITL